MERTSQDEQPARAGATGTVEVGRPAHEQPTVEAEVRAQLAAQLGGPRGALETSLPLVVFTLAYVVVDELRPAIVVGALSGLALLAVRLARRSSTRFVNHGLIGVAIGAVIALGTGRAEAAFLPGIIQSALWATVLIGSIVVRWPAAGFVIGTVLDELTEWRRDPAIVRLSNRLTVVLAAPMVLRVAVKLPLYLAGEVGWLGVSKIALGWPLHAVTLAAAAAILARGNTPMRASEGAGR